MQGRCTLESKDTTKKRALRTLEYATSLLMRGPIWVRTGPLARWVDSFCCNLGITSIQDDTPMHAPVEPKSINPWPLIQNPDSEP